jgi:chromosome segregation ATPase
MSRQRLWLLIPFCLAGLLLLGCTDESVVLKQQISELEKRLQKQEKDLKEFASKLAMPKDFSADMQRIEDQQERISQVIKTKVEPVNSRLEEFRDWVQEAQKDRDVSAKKLTSLEKSAGELQKKLDSENREGGKLVKDVTANKKYIAGLTKSVEDLTKGLSEVKRELQDNNDKVINAVKKTLPKVKEAAVADMKSQLAPMEQSIAALRSGIENDRKALAAVKAQPLTVSEPGGKDVQILVKRIRDLEEIVSTQKSFMLEMGSKMHEFELQLRGVSEYQEPSRPSVSRR